LLLEFDLEAEMLKVKKLNINSNFTIQ